MHSSLQTSVQMLEQTTFGSGASGGDAGGGEGRGSGTGSTEVKVINPLAVTQLLHVKVARTTRARRTCGHWNIWLA